MDKTVEDTALCQIEYVWDLSNSNGMLSPIASKEIYVSEIFKLYILVNQLSIVLTIF